MGNATLAKKFLWSERSTEEPCPKCGKHLTHKTMLLGGPWSGILQCLDPACGFVQSVTGYFGGKMITVTPLVCPTCKGTPLPNDPAVTGSDPGEFAASCACGWSGKNRDLIPLDDSAKEPQYPSMSCTKDCPTGEPSH